jgi:ubiquinone/menaquinone biosynthesis C-methylase UbiE
MSVGTINQFLKVGTTTTFWDRMAEKYPSAAMSLSPGNPMSGTVRSLLEKMGLLADTTHMSGLKVLDVACGSGVVPLLLAMQYDLKNPNPEVQVVATDFSSDMVDRAVKTMEEGGWKGVKVERMDAQVSRFRIYDFFQVMTRSRTEPNLRG